MSIKSILVHLDEGSACQERLHVAEQLAQRFNADLVGLYIYSLDHFNLSVPPTYDGQSMATTAEIRSSEIKQQIDDVVQRIKLIVKQFENAYDRRLKWYSASGKVSDVIARNGHFHDLIVLSRATLHGDFIDEIFVAASNVALKSSSAVLMLPEDYKATDNIENPLIAWNGSREAARAVHEAIPFLSTALHVDVVNDVTSHDLEDLATPSLSDYLSRHSINATILMDEHSNFSQEVLGRINQGLNDMIVIGAMGHSRVRELVNTHGTRQILKQSPVPVLLAS
jgi:nucleotide-binding universal stress UspA family protein